MQHGSSDFGSSALGGLGAECSRLDLNQNETLGYEPFQEAVKTVIPNMSTEQFRCLLYILDGDSSGLVEYGRLSLFVRGTLPPHLVHLAPTAAASEVADTESDRRRIIARATEMEQTAAALVIQATARRRKAQSRVARMRTEQQSAPPVSQRGAAAQFQSPRASITSELGLHDLEEASSEDEGGVYDVGNVY